MITMTNHEFKLLADFIETNYGIHLKDEKQTLLMGRLNTVLNQMGFESFSEYFKYITNEPSGDSIITLVDKITTNHTFFMREGEHFTFFQQKVLPYLSTVIKDKDLRVWCAASSSGEEPYTLAMVIDEFVEKEKLNWDTKVLATDISNNVLEIAKRGVYLTEKMAPLPLYWKQVYIKKIDRDYSEIVDKIKKEVIYRKFNLMEPMFPFKKKFHVIFCRNVMIYFNQETKDALIEKFYEQLEEGGYLFIGHSETVNRNKSRFKYICPAVYRK